MKKLITYFRKNKTDKERLAADLNVSVATIYAWTSGRAKPSVVNAIRLELRTKGAVSVYDWA